MPAPHITTLKATIPGADTAKVLCRSEHCMHLDAYLLGGSAIAAGWAEAFVYRQQSMLGNELQVLQHILKGTAFVVYLDTLAVRLCTMHAHTACGQDVLL